MGARWAALSVHFTANSWRFHESDSHERSLFGDVSGAELGDWPISYADLEPYYTKAEYDLGICVFAGANPFEGPCSKPYPRPPMPVKSSGVLFERATKKLGLHPFPAPVAILSQPYQCPVARVNCGFCESFGCEGGFQRLRGRDSEALADVEVEAFFGRVGEYQRRCWEVSDVGQRKGCSDAKRGFYDEGAIDAPFQFYPASFALSGLPPDARKWGSKYKRLFTTYFNRRMSLLAHTTSLAQSKNTVTLDPDTKDAWGLPALRITSDYHADDPAAMKWVMSKQVEILEAAGAQEVWSVRWTLSIRCLWRA